MKIISLNTGKKKTYNFDNKVVETAIAKTPVNTDVYLGKLGFSGDEQANLELHGGPDKAVCFYPFEHYKYFEQKIKKLPLGAFGENLTVLNMPEISVCIGDIFQIGEAVLQISQPRQPCFKLSLINNIPKMPHMLQETGFTGYYARVLTEGNINTDSKITLLEKHPENISIDFINKIYFHNVGDLETMEKILKIPEISDEVRDVLGRLSGKIK